MLMQAHDHILDLEEEKSMILSQLHTMEKQLNEKTKMLDLLQKELLGTQ